MSTTATPPTLRSALRLMTDEQLDVMVQTRGNMVVVDYLNHHHTVTLIVEGILPDGRFVQAMVAPDGTITLPDDAEDTPSQDDNGDGDTVQATG